MAMPATREQTAFVREVVLPGASGTVPRIDPRYCRFRLEWRASPIHRWGVFASEPIPARRRIIEYTGERINAREAWRRRIRTHLYLFWLNERRAVDGGIGGSGAEFLNHSCDANVYSRVTRGRIFLVSARRIEAGEELVFDYHLSGNYPTLRCRCGAPNCRGVINRQRE
jgi:SET domain-containing protein